MADNMKNEPKFGKCESCGSEMERESGYMVCTGCGHVGSQKMQLADDPMQAFMSCNDNQMFSQQSVHSSVRNELVANMKTTPARQLGIRVAETLALNYSFTAEMKDYVLRHYKRAIDNKNFYRCSLKNKEILAAVCAYITLLNWNESIAIQYICAAVGCNGYEFQQMYTLFVNTYPNLKPEVKPIEELVPSVLNDFRVDKQELDALRDRVIDIISIEKQCWIVEGRSPIHLITAATYLGWKSLKKYERARTKLTQFCKLFGIRYTITTLDRVRELNDVFIKLAKHIPMVKHRSIRIDRNNVALFMNDIIEYSNSLIFDLKRNVYQKVCKSLTDNDMNVKPDNCSEDNDTKWMNSFKRKAVYDKCGPKELKAFEVREEEEENEEPDISDAEIDSYLRSDKEIKIIKKLRKRAKRLEA